MPKPQPRRPERPKRGKIPVGKDSTLPKWIREDVTRVTRKERLGPTLDHISRGADAFAAARYHKAKEELLKAKQLSPRAPVIRELLGLTAYRLGQWKEALAELRTFRRLTGDTMHMAVEMDCLRAMGKNEDVHRVWEELRGLGARPEAMKEARVVYGSFLIDQGDLQRAWEVVGPSRLPDRAFEEDLRQWYVAARVALLLGDVETAKRLVRAIEKHDESLPGLTELREQISEAE